MTPGAGGAIQRTLNRVYSYEGITAINKNGLRGDFQITGVWAWIQSKR